MADTSLPLFDFPSIETIEQVETWRAVEGFDGRYEVSDLGKVRSLLTSKILAPGPTSKGYLSVSLYDGSSPKRPRSFTVHSLVAQAFIGPRPKGMEVNHKDGNKRNCRADNLEYETPTGNKLHAETNGLGVRRYYGSENKNAKLRESDVVKVRKMNRLGLNDAAIARAMNVSDRLIKNILAGKSWKHVPEDAA